MGVLKARFVSFAMVMGIAFLLLVSLLLSAALAALGTMLLAWEAAALHGVNLIAGFVIITVLFAAQWEPPTARSGGRRR